MLLFWRRKENAETSNDSALDFILIMAFTLGAILRIIYVLSADFPINDGGLFYTMMGDIKAAGYKLPTHTSYNRAEIPFAYPPLGLYLTLGLSDLFRIALMDIVQYLPPILSICTMIIFYKLARLLLEKKVLAVYATLAYALLLPAYDNFIMGGGITRAFGLGFVLLTLFFTGKLFISSKWRYLVAVIFFGAFACLTHPTLAWFAAYSTVFLFFVYGRSWKVFLQSIGVTAGILLLTAPWWTVVMSRYGFGVLGYAFTTGDHSFFDPSTYMGFILTVLTMPYTDELLLDILAVIGILGGVMALQSKHAWVILWILLIVVMQYRQTPNLVVVPFSMLVGIGLHELLLPGIARIWEEKRGFSDDALSYLKSPFAKVTLGLVVFVSLLSSYAASPKYGITQDQITAMRWVKENTDLDSSFVIISAADTVFHDAQAEWFPALAERVSISTAQGYEWLPGEVFSKRVVLHSALQKCATQTTECVEKILQEEKITVSHFYLSKSVETENKVLLRSFEDSPNYHVAFTNTAVTIFAGK